MGVDGIVTTNHAGRQVDGAVGSLEVLPDIVDAVREREREIAAQRRSGERMTILFDSGILTGSDIIKAIALGADAVLVGRYV